MPNLEKLDDSVEGFIERRSRALADGSFEDRANACWALVACGSDSLPWCRAMLQSGEHDDVEDAVGILVHIGVPPDWATWIATLAEAADDDRRDLLALLLTPSQQQRLPTIPLIVSQ